MIHSNDVRALTNCGLEPPIAPLTTVKAVVRKVRPKAKGRFLFLGEEKLYLKGVTYGTFAPTLAGEFYPEPDVVADDFAQMVANGINTIRTYTVPPGWLLDLALKAGLWVMVGLPWDQRVTFLSDRQRVDGIRREVREGVRTCGAHPAVLSFIVGNEIPASAVRWHGRKKVERFLEKLCHDVKAEAPQALVSYANYPTTEYLQLPVFDFLAFNVYLESQASLEDYLARLHNLAGERPLILTEVGLDSRRNGLKQQAEGLEWQLRTVFASGCAGAFVFAWTDDWHRNGTEVLDWDFGLTTRARKPKPALSALRSVLRDIPFPENTPWPSVSVIVCSYNGAATIEGTLKGLERLEYPRVEVIVVDDGSTDGTSAIAETFDVRLIRTENRGLSSARNTGCEAASGDIVAYLDDDASPDPHWLHYLVHTLLTTDAAGVGGPNLPPPEDGFVATCVANAPGGPVHVLLDDRDAEHVPGCNMALRKSTLAALGGFDPRFRTAGDDVDLCWRLRASGQRLAFHPAATVWHHRRNSLRGYWRQQVGYGRAEALLAQKWPEKYNAFGHLTWAGRLYGRGLTRALSWRSGRVYGGTWGSLPFQPLYQAAPPTFATLALMPEWYLLVPLFALAVLLSPLWKPLLLALPLLLLGITVPLVQALFSASRASLEAEAASALKFKGLIALLHLLQPAARLYGRLRSGLSPWRRYAGSWVAPRTHTRSLRRASAESALNWLTALEGELAPYHPVRRGGDYDRWDLEVLGGTGGGVRILVALDEEGQLAYFRLHPWMSRPVAWILFGLVFLGVLAVFDSAWIACGLFVALALLLTLRIVRDCGVATALTLRALECLGSRSA